MNINDYIFPAIFCLVGVIMVCYCFANINELKGLEDNSKIALFMLIVVIGTGIASINGYRIYKTYEYNRSIERLGTGLDNFLNIF